MAFLIRRERDGRALWRVVWTDATKGASRAGRREADCENGDHGEALDAAEAPANEREALALGATSKPLRKALLVCYEVLERVKAREAARMAGRRSRHDTPLVDLVDAYLALLVYRVEGGAESPERAEWWRPGFIERPLSAHCLADQKTTFRRFREFLPPGLRAGELSPEVLAGFLRSTLAGGNKPRSYNKARGYLRTMFASLTRDAVLSLFRRDPRELFREDLEALPSSAAEIVVHPVESIRAFLEAAERFAEPGRLLEVHREKRGKVEVFKQSNSSTPSPVLETALLLLCSGARRGEGLALRWKDVDLERGILTVRASKTGTVRYVPLAGDPAGDVAPRFLALLRAWREADPARETVLPRNGESGPAFTRAWARVAKAAGVDVGPQGCRRTFESALAAVGVPSTLSAFWVGHAPAVAYRHYLAFAPGRLPGRTVEEVLGLVPFIERATKRARKGKAFRVVEGEATA
ncbi:MAG: tyrosine-type recombinase/integrase [Planctomycetes bacterium]|nr:tyrosine-type recombinase/integrase [Planctomycetota bacterium]